MSRPCSDLVAWLRQQLDDDERVARAAVANGGTGAWAVSAPGIHPVIYDGKLFLAEPGAIKHARGAAEHIARWDPARVLAEVEAKRFQLAICIALLAPVPTPVGYPEVARQIKLEVEAAEEQVAEKFLKLLARPYAGRDGWRDEWRV